MPAKNSLRIAPSLWSNEERILEVLHLLQKNPQVSEVAFFTSLTHSPLTLDDLQRRAAVLAGVMPRFGEIGVGTGINHLATIGHLDEDLENSLREPWQRLVDANGTETRGSFCLRDKRTFEYLRSSYRTLAQSRPDFIWIDDDMRLENHRPALHTCFCELCLAEFGRSSGQHWSRESLVAAFNAGAMEERLGLRRSWLQHNRCYITDALRGIRQAVDEIDPGISLGLMSSSLYYSGADFVSWAQALNGSKTFKERQVKWRPGAGFYTDDSPISMLVKAHTIGAQVARLPLELTDIQYEHENFPYQRISKSMTMFVAEMAGAVGAGCTGVALNVMGASEGSIDEYESCFETWKRCAPFLDKAVGVFGRSACEGVGLAVTPDLFAVTSLEGEWPEGEVPAIDDFGQIGLPIAYNRQGQRIVLLTGDTVLQWTPEQLLEILRGAVILDGSALEHLMNLGMSRYTGFDIGEVREHDTIEKFSGDEINGVYAGWTRDARPSFWSEKTFILKAQSPGCRILSEIIDFKPQTLGIGSGLFENELGGRVAVMGYYPWRLLNTLAKTEQTKTLCRWLSKDSIMAYVETYARAALWCRRDSAGRPALMLINCCLDNQSLKVRIAGLEEGTPIHIARMDNSETTVFPTDYDGGYHVVSVDNVAPWQAVLLFCEPIGG